MGPAPARKPTMHTVGLTHHTTVIVLTFWEQNPEHVSTVMLAWVREEEKVWVTFSGSGKHPR